MSLDKFYTSKGVAKKFIDKINNICPLDTFDKIIEPSAGCGNILNFLPKDKTIGIDIEPEGDNIIKKDYFKYESDYDPLTNNIKIAVIGNPPFGSGYMNPLAKRFFNHSAPFAEMIAFIVPAKWQTSWKVHKQLDKSFGLYFTEILPKNSFLMNGKEHDVNCCMQIWSKKKLGKSLRFTKSPPTKHEDFDMFLTCDNVKGREDARDKLRNKQYWEFGLKYWGKISVCDIDDIPINTTTHYLIKSNKPFVRKIFENINWKNYITNMGAPNMGGKSLLVKAYEETKKSIKLES